MEGGREGGKEGGTIKGQGTEQQYNGMLWGRWAINNV